MKTFFLIALIWSLGFQAHAQWNTNLMREIKSWRKGDVPPVRLLKFPDGKFDAIAGCGIGVVGSNVSDYIWKIEDADLLAALIFDYRTQSDTFRAAVARLINLKGVGYVSHLIAESRKTQPGALARSEFAVLVQLLRAPYVDIQVARIAPEDLSPDNAESALQVMKTDLQAGISWADAYRKHSDLHPDLRDRAKDPSSVRTLVCYLYDGTVAPTGFDIVTYRAAESLPLEHLRELFRAKGGTHIFRAADGVYLYHIKSYFDGAE